LAAFAMLKVRGLSRICPASAKSHHKLEICSLIDAFLRSET
jgi:hypothetical protein